MRVFVAKQGVIMSNWGSVGVIVRSVRLNGKSSELSGGQWWLNGANKGSVGVIGAVWLSLGLSEG